MPQVSPAPGTVFAGACDDAALRAFYEGAYALLFPSRTEGFGLPPVEAMLCGCPAIVTPAGALPEVCRDAVLYADVDDPASWREALSRLADPELRAEKIAAGRALAARYRWRAAGEQLLAAILERASVPGDEDANPAPVEVETIA
ncbi:glycosyltransferase [Sphingomonas sp. 22R3R2A-7]|uniref:glycosyltransferase n=1 Tax=Sphingomonas sp. 22R3R2A-7 TaxID=3050230 RepID=UPI002FE3F8EE